MADPTLMIAGAKALGGLLGGGGPSLKEQVVLQRTQQQVYDRNKGVNARIAAERGGFNPLTFLQNGGAGNGQMGMGTPAPPLASNELLMGAISDVADVVTGERDRRDAANKLELELGKLKLEQMRGLLAVAPSAVQAVGSGLSPLGRRSARVVTGAGASVPADPALGSQINPVAPTRPKDVENQKNISGVIEIENDWTFGPISLPGDEAPEGFDWVAMAPIAAPQVAHNLGKKMQPLIFGEKPEATEMIVDLDNMSVGYQPESERVPSDRRRDLRDWPWKGFNPFSPKYQGK